MSRPYKGKEVDVKTVTNKLNVFIYTKTRPCNVAIFAPHFIGKMLIVLFFAQNIVCDCGYMLEPPWRSNEYPQSMFWIKSKKNRYTPAYPSFAL